jgi:hypothetical protein
MPNALRVEELYEQNKNLSSGHFVFSFVEEEF